METLQELDEALSAGATRVLLDNFTTYDIRLAMARIAGRATVEISGGVTLARIPELATTGAQFVSVGALTHSAPAVDISFELHGGHEGEIHEGHERDTKGTKEMQTEAESS